MTIMMKKLLALVLLLSTTLLIIAIQPEQELRVSQPELSQQVALH